MATKDELQETIDLLYADREALWRVVKEACALLRVTDDDEKDWPKLDQAVEALKTKRDRLDRMLRCELGEDSAAPGYREAAERHDAQFAGTAEPFMPPPWCYVGQWCSEDVAFARFIRDDCSIYWSEYTTDPDTGAMEPCGPKFRTALEAMESKEVSDGR